MFVFWDSNVILKLSLVFSPHSKKESIPPIRKVFVWLLVLQNYFRRPPEMCFNFLSVSFGRKCLCFDFVYFHERKHNWKCKNRRDLWKGRKQTKQLANLREPTMFNHSQIANWQLKASKTRFRFPNTDRISIYLLSPLHCFCFFYLTKKTLNDIKVMWSFWKQNKTKWRKASYEEKEALKQREKLRKLTNFPNPNPRIGICSRRCTSRTIL